MMHAPSANKICTIPFWRGFNAEVDLADISDAAISVKGKKYHSPLRFLEIYANLDSNPSHERRFTGLPEYNHPLTWDAIQKTFMPIIPGINTSLNEGFYQPPFVWQDCSGRSLCINFTYNTNAIYRIFSNLNEQHFIATDSLDNLIDRACLLLSQIYKAKNHFVMRNMNNNFNMFLISKVVESIVGKQIYNSEIQEYDVTHKSLIKSLKMAESHLQLDIIEKMGLAIGKGVAFIEKRLMRGMSRNDDDEVEAITYQYYQKKLAIDHRFLLIEKIENGCQKGEFKLTVILDDATETVDDLLWLQDLLVRYPFFKVYLLVNTAQVSVNFSVHMLSEILLSPIFKKLASFIGTQVKVVKIYCPFISFQTNFLPQTAKDMISASDVIYIKGANFFETCQIVEKDTFYAFVVYGPISRLYTGLEDYDAVFAYVPAGSAGYVHHREQNQVCSLKKMVDTGFFSLGG